MTAEPRDPLLGPHAAQPLRQAEARFRAWMMRDALPFWCSHGYDHEAGGFVEHLELDGRPADVSYKRVRAQARQIYVFSHAAMLGWRDGLPYAEAAWDFLRQHGWGAEGGWVRRLGRSGGIVDPVIDLYDNAFVLLALAWLGRATGRADALDWADRTLAVIAANATAPASPGYHDTFPPERGWRQQNPHMHLLESMLALAAATGERRFADGADALVRLALDHLIDPETGTIAEYFDAAWRRAPPPDGTRIEPGHQFEWVWLLWQAGALLGRDLRAPALRLYEFAMRHGRDPRTGQVVNAVSLEGAVLDGHSRLWPQTEALKAQLAVGGAAASEAAVAFVHLLLDRHLADCPPGTWCDRLDDALQPSADIIPSSSLYHLFVAFAELHRIAGEG
jgi:mannose/cellobiose epimerase-like protein (N-acyl-D-glucosamine 2-epimerase family)